MTYDQTLNWIEYHGVQQPSWHRWVEKLEGESRNILVSAWAKGFVKIEISDARDASDGMTTGTVKRPFHLEDHVAAIIVAASELRSERRHAETPSNTNNSREAIEADRQSYLNDRAHGHGLLDRFARRVGIMPPDDRPITREELLRQLAVVRQEAKLASIQLPQEPTP